MELKSGDSRIFANNKLNLKSKRRKAMNLTAESCDKEIRGVVENYNLQVKNMMHLTNEELIFS